MAQLSEKDRVVLELGYFVRVADAEVARRIGVQPQSIPMLRKRARDRLKKLLVSRPEFCEWM
jgi:DNA-directed RNA polymerase specialized sigma subunit